MKATLLVSALVSGSSIVAAAPAAKPLPADQHQPPVALDPSSVALALGARGSEGYTPGLEFTLMGVTSKSDRVRLEWKQGGKVIATTECSGRYNAKFLSLGTTGCSFEKPTKAKGPVELAIVYIDDQQDKEYLVQTLKVDVKEWKSIGKTVQWGIVPDDLLALGYVHFMPDSARSRNVPMFELWSTNDLHGHASFRCTVDGNRLPDFDASVSQTRYAGEVTHSWTREKESRAYTYRHLSIDPGFSYGTLDDFAKAAGKTPAELAGKVRVAAEHPGNWDCALRIDGKTARTFTFAVDANGTIAPSALASGAWPGLKTFDDMTLVDMRIPEANGLEQRIRKEALVKSVGFGLPWPQSPKAKDAQAAFPKSMGTPD